MNIQTFRPAGCTTGCTTGASVNGLCSHTFAVSDTFPERLVD